ncbi:hypothetical protein HanXRQr2_Chr16g0731901 [Helianthus annuus]|uniref:Uncharacterized protein n=1 Tax=Helianthus annuus TaxID=4232 RepID=A0A9K3DNZ6_HELAN|nr:hypothetical protein HanXRQr2_Chr16g0731901 [Helianthus annuus]KAJ0819940.1 hypothetical protein HanPSC8_Chr16g0701921 [Helianthus annuus]
MIDHLWFLGTMKTDIPSCVSIFSNAKLEYKINKIASISIRLPIKTTTDGLAFIIKDKRPHE